MNRFIEKFYFFGIIFLNFLLANPEFDQDGDGQYDGLPLFNFDANLTAVIENGSIGVVGEDYLVAMVGDEIRGIGIASVIPFGTYAGLIAYLTTYGSYDGGSVDHISTTKGTSNNENSIHSTKNFTKNTKIFTFFF